MKSYNGTNESDVRHATNQLLATLRNLENGANVTDVKINNGTRRYPSVSYTVKRRIDLTEPVEAF